VLKDCAIVIGEWWLSDARAKAAPATCGGRKTSDYIGTLMKKRKVFYRGAVHGAANWEMQDSFGIIKNDVEDL